MNPLALVLAILSCGGIVIAASAPYHWVVRALMVLTIVGADAVLIGMKHFQEARRKVKDAPEEWFK